LCLDFLEDPAFTRYLIRLLFRKYQPEKVTCLLSNSLPLYVSNSYTGVVISAGHRNVSVMPIVDGLPMTEAFKYNESAGKRLSELFIEGLERENEGDPKSLNSQNRKTAREAVPLLAKALSRGQAERYFLAEGEKAMKGCVIGTKMGSSKVSLFTCVSCVELALFGDSETTNVALLFLSSLLLVDKYYLKRVVQNVILSGGIPLLRNMAGRLREEILHHIDNDARFQPLRPIKALICFNAMPFPPNTLNWIGASIAGPFSTSTEISLNAELVRREEFETSDLIMNQYAVKFNSLNSAKEPARRGSHLGQFWAA